MASALPRRSLRAGRGDNPALATRQDPDLRSDRRGGETAVYDQSNHIGTPSPTDEMKQLIRFDFTFRRPAAETFDDLSIVAPCIPGGKFPNASKSGSIRPLPSFDLRVPDLPRIGLLSEKFAVSF